MKTIWYISKYSSPLKYGHGSRNCYLAREFNRLGHRTIVIASDSTHLASVPRFPSVFTREVIDGVETWWIRTLKYRRTASLRRILSWMDFEMKLWRMPQRDLPKPDVVIASSLSLLSVLNGYRLKKKYGARFVFEVRDIWPLTLTEEGGFSRWHPLTLLLGWVEAFGYRHADVVVGTMPNLAEHVREITGREIPCCCVPIGLDPVAYADIQPLPEGFVERYIPRGKFVVGYAGSIGTTNDLDTLLECVRHMKDRDDVHFVLAGDGALRDEYQRRTGDLKNISFAPKVPKNQVQSLLKECDVLYFSAMDSKVWRYGQSLNKVIDYMYAGKPVIASYNGYPSMLDESGCGVFVPAGDVAALEAAISRYQALPKAELEAIGQKGKAWLLSNRTYDTMAAEYLRLF